MKNSKPITNLAKNGAVFHPAIPQSIKVNSNGSIGNSFVYALKTNISPTIIEIGINKNIDLLNFI